MQFNLESFACRNLLVSFAVVNASGLSGYSESLNITVHGGTYYVFTYAASHVHVCIVHTINLVMTMHG